MRKKVFPLFPLRQVLQCQDLGNRLGKHHHRLGKHHPVCESLGNPLRRQVSLRQSSFVTLGNPLRRQVPLRQSSFVAQHIGSAHHTRKSPRNGQTIITKLASLSLRQSRQRITIPSQMSHRLGRGSQDPRQTREPIQHRLRMHRCPSRPFHLRLSEHRTFQLTCCLLPTQCCYSIMQPTCGDTCSPTELQQNLSSVKMDVYVSLQKSIEATVAGMATGRATIRTSW
jgi:hypothetical protein